MIGIFVFSLLIINVKVIKILILCVEFNTRHELVVELSDIKLGSTITIIIIEQVTNWIDLLDIRQHVNQYMTSKHTIMHFHLA